MNILTSFFPQMVGYEPSHLTTPYVSACFGMPWVKHVNLLLQVIKCVWAWHMCHWKMLINLVEDETWTKKSAKGWQEWDKLCSDGSLCPHKLKMPMKIRIVVKSCFSKILWNLRMSAIFCYYNSSFQLQSNVPCGNTWAMAKAMTKTFI